MSLLAQLQELVEGLRGAEWTYGWMPARQVEAAVALLQVRQPAPTKCRLFFGRITRLPQPKCPAATITWCCCPAGCLSCGCQHCFANNVLGADLPPLPPCAAAGQCVPQPGEAITGRAPPGSR